MEKNYRIKRIETKNVKGDIVSTRYVNQVKFLFWWFNCYTKTGYTLGKFHGGSSDMMIGYKCYLFTSYQEAKEHFDNYIVTPFKIKHYGNTIIKVYNEYGGGDVYINKSKTREPYASSTTYEYSYKLENLKQKIESQLV